MKTELLEAGAVVGGGGGGAWLVVEVAASVVEELGSKNSPAEAEAVVVAPGAISAVLPS